MVAWPHVWETEKEELLQDWGPFELYSEYQSGHTEQDPLSSNETLVLPDGSVDNVPTTQAEEPVFTPQNPRELWRRELTH